MSMGLQPLVDFFGAQSRKISAPKPAFRQGNAERLQNIVHCIVTGNIPELMIAALFTIRMLKKDVKNLVTEQTADFRAREFP